MASRPIPSARFRWLPLVGVALLMGVLVGVTFAVEARTTTLRRNLNQELLPASTLTGRIAFALSREMSQLRAYAITGQQRFLAAYRRSRASEEATWRVLLQRADALEPATAAYVVELREAALRWHALVQAASPVLGPAPPQEAVLLLDTELYEEILARFDALASELDGRIAQNVAELERVETVQTGMTIILALLAVAAGAGATWLVGRTQALAAEADRRREQVQRLSEGRARLMRGLTHDVKNPLAAAVGYVGLLEIEAGDRLGPEHGAWLARIRTTVGRANAILDDLFDVSQAESGRLPMEFRSLSVQSLIDEAASDEQASFDGAGITFERAVPPDLPPVRADPRRVQQILGNLLSNARKYTPGGGRVTLWAMVRKGRRERAAPGPGPWIAIAVSDTGPGIPIDRQDVVFEEFTRLDPDVAPGFGLGLAISRRLALLMGGDLTLESRPGKGATFTLWLPLEGEEGEQAAA